MSVSHLNAPIGMINEEGLPALRGWGPGLGHVLCNRGVPDIDAELEQLAVDARRTPKRVGNARLANKVANFGWDTRSPAPRSRFPAPIGREASTMPAKHGFQFDDLQSVPNIGSQRVYPGEHQPVDAGEGQTARGLAVEHIQWCRSTRISASSAPRDRNSPAKAHHISLQSSIIARKHQPIRAGLPAPDWVSGRDSSMCVVICSSSAVSTSLSGMYWTGR